MDEKKIYNENWRQWEDMKIHGPMSRHIRRMVFTAMKKTSVTSLLDVGCGPGIFLKEVAQKYPSCRLSGVDISDTAIELSKINVPQSFLSVMDVSLNVPSGLFDCIVLLDVAEHIEHDEAAFSNLASVCNGHIIVATLEGRMREFESNVGHVRNYKKNELPEKLKAAGFDIVTYSHWGWPTFSPLYRNLSGRIAADSKPLTPLRKVLGYIAYWGLGCCIPGIGDSIIVVGKKRIFSER
jgi:2-polyprenyl-3-methyl-5-hydroxy-6-metoxy-1,4-benzoquinol methylase